MSETMAKTCWRYTGALGALSAGERTSLLRRTGGTRSLVRETTAEIVRRVRVDGDSALREMARQYDDVELEELEVPRAVRQRALEGIERPLRSALERAARNIDRKSVV